jgi:hypothetical protein
VAVGVCDFRGLGGYGETFRASLIGAFCALFVAQQFFFDVRPALDAAGA